ncbi:MAG: hypothetical protein ACF8OB_10180 [Phycisphaeraceae bacterium JB051]
MQENTKHTTPPKVPCKHWQDCGLLDGGCCSINAYRHPSHGICLHVCHQYDGPDRGLGDTVKRAIHKISGGRIKPCGACQKRQRKLNQLIPYHGE